MPQTWQDSWAGSQDPPRSPSWSLMSTTTRHASLRVSAAGLGALGHVLVPLGAGVEPEAEPAWPLQGDSNQGPWHTHLLGLSVSLPGSTVGARSLLQCRTWKHTWLTW